MCFEIMCLFVNAYISKNQFETLFLDNIETFEKDIDHNLYLDILSVRWQSETDIMHLKSRIRSYLEVKHRGMLESYTDAYIE